MIKFADSMVLLLYCGLIFWLSNQPWLAAPSLFENQDKLHHLGAYFIMGILAWRNFRHFLRTPALLAAISVTFCSLYGISDEWHQSFVEGRNSDLIDWLADTLGASLAVLSIHYLTNKQFFDKLRGKTIQNP
jgi:VanZ family protein